MRLSPYTFEVSGDFVRGALELAFKKVYENRRERYKDSSELVRNAIEFRYDRSDDFIENFLECGNGSIDPYDEVDSRFGAEEMSYEDIWNDIYIGLNDEEREELGEVYEGKTSQDDLIHEWCNDNNYWYDDYDSLAVQDCFSYSS